MASDLCSDFVMASAGGSQHQKAVKKVRISLKKVRISLFLRECPFSALLEPSRFLSGTLNILLLDLKELIGG